MKTLNKKTNASRLAAFASAVVLASASLAPGQSSSLYNAEPAPAPVVRQDPHVPQDPLSPAVARVSLASVRMPEPKQYAVQDFITIIVRESTQSDSKQNLDTTKESKFDGDIKAFPNLNINQLLKGMIQGGDLANGPKVDADLKKDFKGDAEAKRSDTFTTRITARVIDIKPNGTMVLEARSHIKTDEESTDMVLTGACRKEDVAADNTVVSTQLFDLHLDKQHGGELRKTTKKGWITKVFDGVFGF